jgi:hypothetical protein
MELKDNGVLTENKVITSNSITDINDEFVRRLVDQAVTLWINPEIEKRKKEGTLSKNFELRVAQVLFLGYAKMEVKLNEEVKAVMKTKLNRAVKQGDAIYFSDIEGVESIDVSEFYPDAGHITILFYKDHIVFSFDTRYNKRKISQVLDAAKEFYGSASDNLNKNRLRPFFDDSFSCVELCATAILLIVPDDLLLSFKGGHPHRYKRLVGWTELGNSKPEYLSLFEKLKECRSSARYLEGNKFQKENPEDILKILKEMLDFAAEKIS